MSIASIQNRITELQILHTALRPADAAADSRGTVSFPDLLSQEVAVRMEPQPAGTVDVAEAMRQAGLLPAAQSAEGSETLQIVSVQTGAMIPEVVVPAQPGAASWSGQPDPTDGALEKAAPYMSIMSEASAEFGVPVNVILGVIRAESDFNPRCVSYAGAKGLMQIMPCNEQDYGVTDPYDARQNIFCGTHEIADLLHRYNGDLKLALAAYNTGPGNIAKRGVTSSSDRAYSSVPQSVRDYADRVLRYAGLAS